MIDDDTSGQIYHDIKASHFLEEKLPFYCSSNGRIIAGVFDIPTYQWHTKIWKEESLPFDLNVLTPEISGTSLRLIKLENRWVAFSPNGEADSESTDLLQLWEDKLDLFSDRTHSQAIVGIMTKTIDVSLTVVAMYDGSGFQNISNQTLRPYGLCGVPILGVVGRHARASLKSISKSFKRFCIRSTNPDERTVYLTDPVPGP